MRTVFFCGHKSRYGFAHLKPMLESRLQVLAVVLATDERWRFFHEKLTGKSYYDTRGHRFTLSFKSFLKQILPVSVIRSIKRDYHEVAKTNVLSNVKVPLIYTYDVNDSAFLEKLKMMNPDLIISAAYPQIFAKELIKIPPDGAVNFHPSLLPKYRGAHPHFWAIAKGEEISGLTAHYMTENIDDGHIIAQIEFPIWQYTYSELYDKIVEEVPTIVKNVELFFMNNNRKAQPQNHAEATYFREPREIHKRIFWDIHSAEEVKNLIRTQQAFCFFRHVKIKPIKGTIAIINRNMTNNVSVAPGTIVDVKSDCVVVKTVDRCINIESLEDHGKKLSPMEWTARWKVNIGEKFD